MACTRAGRITVSLMRMAVSKLRTEFERDYRQCMLPRSSRALEIWARIRPLSINCAADATFASAQASMSSGPCLNRCARTIGRISRQSSCEGLLQGGFFITPGFLAAAILIDLPSATGTLCRSSVGAVRRHHVIAERSVPTRVSRRQAWLCGRLPACDPRLAAQAHRAVYGLSRCLFRPKLSSSVRGAASNSRTYLPLPLRAGRMLAGLRRWPPAPLQSRGRRRRSGTPACSPIHSRLIFFAKVN